MSSERGFTLIEALVATLVLTVGLLAMAELLAVSVRMHKLGRDSATATRLAQDKFEEMMKMNFTPNPAFQVATARTPWRRTWPTTSTRRPTRVTRAGGGCGRSGRQPGLRTVTVRVIPPTVRSGPTSTSRR